MKVSDFYANEFVDFASYSTIRMIASAIDGMKNVHRKIVYTILEKNIRQDIKVSQLNSKVAEFAHYLHGDMSGAIVTMAQNYVGTNNLPLLAAEGNFGTRFAAEASAPRYIFTYGMPILFDMMNKYDAKLLPKQYFEGVQIEPKYYVPTLPLLLINGSSGIASGFKQYILPRDPNKITSYLIDRLNGSNKKFNIKPHFNGFKGKIEKGDKKHQWKIYGTVKRISATQVEITELPVGYDLPKYIAVLDGLKDKGQIVSYTDNSDKNVFNFKVKFTKHNLSKLDDTALLEKLKLIKTEVELFNALDENLRVVHFADAAELMDYFIDVKLRQLKKRKEYLIQKLEQEITLYNSKYTFIKHIVDGTLVINNTPIQVIEQQLDKIDAIIKQNDSYDYLLKMPLYSVTTEKMRKLEKQIEEATRELDVIRKSTIESMWLKDIELLELDK